MKALEAVKKLSELVPGTFCSAEVEYNCDSSGDITVECELYVATNGYGDYQSTSAGNFDDAFTAMLVKLGKTKQDLEAE